MRPGTPRKSSLAASALVALMMGPGASTTRGCCWRSARAPAAALFAVMWSAGVPCAFSEEGTPQGIPPVDPYTGYPDYVPAELTKLAQHEQDIGGFVAPLDAAATLAQSRRPFLAAKYTYHAGVFDVHKNDTVSAAHGTLVSSGTFAFVDANFSHALEAQFWRVLDGWENQSSNAFATPVLGVDHGRIMYTFAAGRGLKNLWQQATTCPNPVARCLASPWRILVFW